MTHAQTTTVVGAGFTGLCVAYELARAGHAVRLLEAESVVGGLAAAFHVGGVPLDRFYHHWFTSDREVMGLIDELGLTDRVAINPTRTGIYYAKNFFRLSTPWDLLSFTPLALPDRVRLGLLALRARRVTDWRELENMTAAAWLRKLGGAEVYRVVWEPLLRGKFGAWADQISAVWFWNKLKLRGGSRGKGGEERLAYFRGGFVGLAEELVTAIRAAGGRVELDTPVSRIRSDGRGWLCETPRGPVVSDQVVVTTALPLVADMVHDWAGNAALARLRRINYIGNVCLILELDRSLSSTYWLNVNDVTFPFVGVIEHTNFERPETYGGRHIVYLSKYLPHTDPLYAMEADGFLDYAMPYLKTMFPALERSWIVGRHLWRARWSQPVVEQHYGSLIPEQQMLGPGLHLCTMAQIYPEDRGTNYAIREGRRVGREIAEALGRDEVER